MGHVINNANPKVRNPATLVTTSITSAPSTVLYSMPKGPNKSVRMNASATLLRSTTIIVRLGIWLIVTPFVKKRSRTNQYPSFTDTNQPAGLQLSCFADGPLTYGSIALPVYHRPRGSRKALRPRLSTKAIGRSSVLSLFLSRSDSIFFGRSRRFDTLASLSFERRSDASFGKRRDEL